MKKQKKHNLMENHKSFFIFLILLSLCSLPITAFAGVLGDANRDGQVNIIDAFLVARGSPDEGMSPGIDYIASDVNCDGTVNIVDALQIAFYSAGQIKVFPCSAHVLELTIKYGSGVPISHDSVLITPPGISVSGSGVHLISYTEPTTVTLTASEYWYSCSPGGLTSVERLYPDWDDNPNDGIPYTMTKVIEGYVKVQAEYIHGSIFCPK